MSTTGARTAARSRLNPASPQTRTPLTRRATPSVPFCAPDKIINSAENLGEVLRGDRIENSVYSLAFRVDTLCAASCAVTLTEASAAAFASKIEDDYRVNMILDNLPVAQVHMRDGPSGPVKTYDRGYPVGRRAAGAAAAGAGGGGGVLSPDQYELHNHLRFTVLYHADGGSVGPARLVGFEVQPLSVRHRRSSAARPFDPQEPALRTCDPEKGAAGALDGAAPAQAVRAGEEVVFTHDFLYVPSEIRWASRWDTYLLMTDVQIHWFSIVNSLVIVLFLSGMVARGPERCVSGLFSGGCDSNSDARARAPLTVPPTQRRAPQALIMARTLHADISAYNAASGAPLGPPGTPGGGGSAGAAELGAASDAADAAEEAGWKLVHGDVLRAPQGAGGLAVAVGTGVQLLAMSVVTLFFALLGFLSPANRGALMTAALLLFALCGLAGGYAAARLYRGLFRGAAWRGNALRTALFFPGVAATVFLTRCVRWAGGREGGGGGWPARASGAGLWLLAHALALGRLSHSRRSFSLLPLSAAARSKHPDFRPALVGRGALRHPVRALLPVARLPEAGPSRQGGIGGNACRPPAAVSLSPSAPHRTAVTPFPPFPPSQVRHIGAPRRGGRLLRRPGGGAVGPGAHEQDPAPGAGPGLVPVPARDGARRRHPPLRRRLRGAVLHPDQHVAAPVLLCEQGRDVIGDTKGDRSLLTLPPRNPLPRRRVRLRRAGAAHPGHHLRRDRGRAGLLPGAVAAARLGATPPHHLRSRPRPLRRPPPPAPYPPPLCCFSCAARTTGGGGGRSSPPAPPPSTSSRTRSSTSSPNCTSPSSCPRPCTSDTVRRNDGEWECGWYGAGLWRLRGLLTGAPPPRLPPRRSVPLLAGLLLRHGHHRLPRLARVRADHRAFWGEEPFCSNLQQLPPRPLAHPRTCRAPPLPLSRCLQYASVKID